MRLGYLFFPRFPVQRRVLEQPSLSGRPVLLHADERGTQRVRFASGAALKRGIRPGMSVASASALEPSVVRLVYEPGLEHGALMTVGETMLPLAPGFQLDAPEGMWLDASAAHLSGGESAWAQRVLDALRSLGLRARCVVGSERFTTQALARWSSNDSVIIAPERGGPRLAALPLLCLEEGWLGAEQTASYRALGLSTLGELASLPPQALTGRFGLLGLQAARLCRGEDDSRFLADELSEVMEELVQLDWPAEALEPVLFALKTLVDRLSGRLQGRQLAAVRLTVTVGLESGDPLRVPLVLARASAESRLLTELIRHRLTDLTVQQPITTLHVRIDETSADRGRQLILGDAPAGEVALEVVMSRLQSALGEDALFSAAPFATHRPEEGWRAIAPLPQDATLSATSWLGPAADGPPAMTFAPSSARFSAPTSGSRAVPTTPLAATPLAAAPLAATPLAAAPLAAAPLAATPLAATPLAATPLAATPLAAAPLAATPLAATPLAATPLAATPLAATPLAAAPLAATPLAATPLAATPLAATSSAPLAATPLAAAPLAATPLAATPLAATPLAATPLAATPLAAAPLAATPLAATPLAATSSAPLAATPLAAAPLAATPLAATPLAATPLAATSSAPLAATPLAAAPLAATPLAATPLAATPLAATPLAAAPLAAAPLAAAPLAAAPLAATPLAATSSAPLAAAPLAAAPLAAAPLAAAPLAATPLAATPLAATPLAAAPLAAAPLAAAPLAAAPLAAAPLAAAPLAAAPLAATPAAPFAATPHDAPLAAAPIAPTETPPAETSLVTSSEHFAAPAPHLRGKKWLKRKAKVEQSGTISLSTLAHRPPRMFREPALLRTEFSADGSLEHVHLAGKRRRVELLIGPERLVGGWWSSDPFTRDYYRVQLEGVGQLWIFRDGTDGAFYVQGVFD